MKRKKVKENNKREGDENDEEDPDEPRKKRGKKKRKPGMDAFQMSPSLSKSKRMELTRLISTLTHAMEFSQKEDIFRQCQDLIQFEFINNSACSAVAMFPEFFSDSQFFENHFHKEIVKRWLILFPS